MVVKVSIKSNLKSFDSFHFEITLPAEEESELKKLEQKLSQPYELPEHTGALRGPIIIWGTSG